MMTAPKLPPPYQPSVEDLLAIQEYFDECRAVAAKLQREREIAETDTLAQRPSRQARFTVAAWEAEPSLGTKIALALEGAL